MKRLHYSLILGIFLFAPSFALSCNFCSGKPKGLSSGGPVQDPGSPTLSPSSGGSGASPSQSPSTRGSGSSFTYDLKDYKADGQRSTNPNWSSSIPSDSR